MKTLTHKELQKYDKRIHFIHPINVVKDTFTLVGKVGAKVFLNSPKYDSNRDLFISSMFALGIRNFEKREWFINRGDNPPDVLLNAFSNRKIKEKPIDHIEMELIEIRPTVLNPSDAYDIVYKKKLTPTYRLSKESILLVFLNNSNGPSWCNELAEKMKGYEGIFSEIWTIYLYKVDPINSVTYAIRNVHPGDENELFFNLKKEISKGIVYQSPYFEKYGVKIKD